MGEAVKSQGRCSLTELPCSWDPPLPPLLIVATTAAGTGPKLLSVAIVVTLPWGQTPPLTYIQSASSSAAASTEYQSSTDPQ